MAGIDTFEKEYETTHLHVETKQQAIEGVLSKATLLLGGWGFQTKKQGVDSFGAPHFLWQNLMLISNKADVC